MKTHAYGPGPSPRTLCGRALSATHSATSHAGMVTCGRCAKMGRPDDAPPVADKPTRLAEVKAERDTALAALSRWQLAFAWSEAGLTAGRWGWRDSSGGAYEARLVVGPRAGRALVVLVFYGSAVPSLDVAEFEEWAAGVVSRGAGSDALQREGECAAVDTLRQCYRRRLEATQ